MTYFNRRRALQGLLSTAALPLAASIASSARAQDNQRRFLFVICAGGAADIRDSLWPLVGGEAGAGLRNYGAADVATIGNLRCIERAQPLRFYAGTDLEGSQQRTFLTENGADTLVVATEGTSVNHAVAAKRWLTGAGAVLRGRTLLESHAARYATVDMPLPAVNLANGGYIDPGDDSTLNAIYRAETVQDALLLGLATDPLRGVLTADRGIAKQALLERARRVRETLDDNSSFVRRFAASSKLGALRQRRKETIPLMQELDLISELTMLSSSARIPLDDYGLSSSSSLPALNDAGLVDLARDPFMAQAALAYLLCKSGASCAVAIGTPTTPIVLPTAPGESFTLKQTPIAFDFSHTDHHATQQTMWSRVFAAANGLSRLLKATPFQGGTMWDQSLIYIATDFGRSLQGNGDDQVGTGHELNNGMVLASPLLAGGRRYGELDTNTGLIRGFNGSTGAVSDDVVREPELVATIARALDHDLAPGDDAKVQNCLLR